MALTIVIPRVLAACVLGAALATTPALSPAALGAGPLDPDLIATVELRDGYIDYELEPGPLHFLDEENQPLAVQVVDGCAVNGHYWIFGAGLSGVSLPLSLLDQRTGKETRVTLPPYDPGQPIDTVFDPEALPICGDDVQMGGLPALDALATFTAAGGRGEDGVDAIRLLSDGSDRAYRRLVRVGQDFSIISRGLPVVAIDGSPEEDQIYLFTEGRTPRTVEGIVFSGAEGMLPDRAQLDRALAKVTKARVRRAFETAKNGRVPRGIIEDLGLRRVERVHHVGLDFSTLGADAYLAMARWIREGSKPPEPPALVQQRFGVELVRADGTRTALPLTGPFVGSASEGRLWQYGTSDAMVQIADTCVLDGSYWVWAGARTDEPLELVVTDDATGGSVTQLLWTDREEISRLADTASLELCP